MAKVLLKHVGIKPNKSYQRDIAKIAKVAITVRSINAPKIEIYSFKELTNRKEKATGSNGIQEMN